VTGLADSNPSSRPTTDLIESLRESIAAHYAQVAIAADSECRICRGRGWTGGYIAPSKEAQYPCVCTGHGYNRSSVGEETP
jgi:hypothetical protein